MVYVIVDPKLLLIESSEKPITQETFIQFLGFISSWGTIARDHAITFGLSRECVDILKRITHNVFSTDRMAQVVQQLLPHRNEEDVFNLLDPFLTQLLHESHIEPVKIALEDHLMLDFEPARDNVLVAPPELLDDVPDDLAEAFQRTIGHVTFASRNPAKPLDTLREIYLLTATDLQKSGTEGSILVNMHYSWVLDARFNPSLESQTRLSEMITGITPTIDITQIIKPVSFKTVEEAVEAASKRYPNRLIITRKALETAQSSGFPKPIKVYKALCALVETWLPAYDLKDKYHAHSQYYERMRYEISPESERVHNKPNLRSQREVVYNGETHFVEDHVKMETGPNAVRIYFKPIIEDGQNRLLIARAGKHPDTGRGY